MLKKEKKVCAGCEQVQMVVPGRRCRFCGDSRMWTKLDHAKAPENIISTYWDQIAERESADELPHYIKKMIRFLTQEKMTYAQFVKKFNDPQKRKRDDVVKLSVRRFRAYVNLEDGTPRETAIRIARMAKARQYPVWECPIFHPHAAMRVYTKQYYEYWRTHRAWYRANPGKDPGPWWDAMKPEETVHE